MRRLKAALRSLSRPVRHDLNQDIRLRYILLFGAGIASIGLWIHVPNFAGPDEYSRLLQPMKVAGRILADPSLDSIRTAATDGRALGATFYLYAIILVPMFLVVLVTGELGQFMALGGIESRWVLWHEVPAWFWTGSILLGRVVNVLLAVGSLYILYRLGVRIQGRQTGRMAALGLAVTFAFVESARLINEDIPMVFFLLCTILLSLQYIASGDKYRFFLASFTAGLAVAFKISGGSAVIVVGAAYVFRTFRQSRDGQTLIIQPRVLLGGITIGLLTIFFGFPSALFGGPGELWVRLTHTAGQKTTLQGGVPAGIGFWLLRGYLATFGLPLFAGIVIGVITTTYYSIYNDFDRRIVLITIPVIITLGVFSQWQYVRVHHLLPTIPPLLLIGAVGIKRLQQSQATAVQILVAFIFVTSAVFSGIGTAKQISDPRERGTDWLRENTNSTETIEVYENSIADVAALHGHQLQHYEHQEENATYSSSLVLNETKYTNWMLNMPSRQPEYIQLTESELQYTTRDHPYSEKFPQRSEYISGLLNQEYNYTTVAKFGEKETEVPLSKQLLWSGLDPEPESRSSVVIILKREHSAD